MRIVAISDTHNQLSQVKVPEGDLLIHCGDFTCTGSIRETTKFVNRFKKYPHKHKIVIPGNHDVCLQAGHPKFKYDGIKLFQEAGGGVIFHTNEELFNLESLAFAVSPWVTPINGKWAYEAEDSAREAAYEMLRANFKNPDIIITHSPPAGIMDAGIGCEFLSRYVKSTKPKYHIFGHAHGQYGVLDKDGTTYINCALLDDNYRLRGKPAVFDV